MRAVGWVRCVAAAAPPLRETEGTGAVLKWWMWFRGRRQPSRGARSALASARDNRATWGNSFTTVGTCSPCRALCVGSWRQPSPPSSW
eukprot:2831094-Alexandrium_andersonii.AAC.1